MSGLYFFIIIILIKLLSCRTACIPSVPVKLKRLTALQAYKVGRGGGRMGFYQTSHLVSIRQQALCCLFKHFVTDLI